MCTKTQGEELKGFTGIEGPYEEPIDRVLRLTTTDCVPEDNAGKIVEYLVSWQFLALD